ncbi:MAG: hypothetical protein ACUVRP_07375 [Chlorobiales bacterium]
MINFEISSKSRKDILNAIEKEYGEIGDYDLEDNYVSFTVYLDSFEDPSEEIVVDENTKLRFVDKFDDPFYSLIYKITNIQNLTRTI